MPEENEREQIEANKYWHANQRSVTLVICDIECAEKQRERFNRSTKGLVLPQRGCMEVTSNRFGRFWQQLLNRIQKSLRFCTNDATRQNLESVRAQGARIWRPKNSRDTKPDNCTANGDAENGAMTWLKSRGGL